MFILEKIDMCPFSITEVIGHLPSVVTIECLADSCQPRTLTKALGYSLELVSKKLNYIHQTNRVGQTDYNHTIDPCFGCSSD